MAVIPKAQKPVKIRFGKGVAQVLFEDGTRQNLHEHSQLMWAAGSGHYGIHLIRDMQEDKAPETIYFTQEEIRTIKFNAKEGTITLLEENKYPLGWVFNEKGECLQKATYYKTWRPTRTYIYDQAKEIIDCTGNHPICTSAEQAVDSLIDIANDANNRSLDLGKASRPEKASDGGKQ